MKLTDLQIENFGAESGLRLPGISPLLNVVFSPNGAGKTTVIHFIRWMMFGDRDEISRRYLNNHGVPSSGTMSISDRYGHRTLRRTSQSGSQCAWNRITHSAQSVRGQEVTLTMGFPFLHHEQSTGARITCSYRISRRNIDNCFHRCLRRQAC